MKLCKKRKIRQMSDPFQNLIADGLGPLGRNRSQEKCLCQESIGLLHQGHLPAKRCSRSQRCVKPGLRISVMQGLRRQEIWTSFSWIQLFVKKLQSFDMNISINQTNKPSMVYSIVLCHMQTVPYMDFHTNFKTHWHLQYIPYHTLGWATKLHMRSTSGHIF